VFLGAISRTFGFRLTGKRPWRFASLQITYHELGW